MKKHRSLVILVVTSVLMVACGLFTSSGTNTVVQNESDSSQPVSPSVQPSLESPVVDEDVFPLTPDPINVTATLETENAATYNKGSYTQSVKTESADGAIFELYLMNDMIFKEDENGELAIDYDSDITMTPVSSIEGLPFSQGYLAAVHLGPDGAKLVESADLTMEIPGDYDPSTLIGFAADGTGDDLHLYPATFSSYDGKTYAEFYVSHFSLYGVAQVLQGEIESQLAHPPVNPASQDDQELAPLIHIEPVKVSKLEKALSKSYDRSVKNLIENLDDTSCNKVSNTALELERWLSKVKIAKMSASFQTHIKIDQYAVLERLTNCVRETCDTCINPQSGEKADKAKVGQMLVLIEFARSLSITLREGETKITNWWLLANECAKSAGLPQQAAGIAADGGGEVPKVSCP
jgi:hypothetical protein